MRYQLGRSAMRLLRCFAWCSTLLFFAWAIGAIRYLTYLPHRCAFCLALAYGLGACYCYKRMSSNRSAWLAGVGVSIVIVYALTLLQRPSNERDWIDEQSRLAVIDISGGHVRIKNRRRSEYRTESDFDLRYDELHFEEADLKAVWFVVQKFTALEGLAHTFVSFEVQSDTGPEFVCISVEVRRERGEVYSPIRGLYRQFELAYVVGTERDVIGQRTVMRPNDRVYLYRVNANPEEVQALFRDFAATAVQLNQEPRFYHTLLRNCTNEIVRHTYELTPEPINWLDPRIALPGFSAQFAYANNLIGDSDSSFSDLQSASRIDQIAREVGLVDDFSSRIRKHQR